MFYAKDPKNVRINGKLRRILLEFSIDPIQLSYIVT